MSINKAQAAALADGFLDDIGEDNVLQPKETFTELFVLAGELVELTQQNLINNNSISTGELSSSISLENPTQEGNVISVDMYMNFYGQFINDGVKGTRSGEGLYQFKTEFPSPAMIANLQRSINKAGKKQTNVAKYSAVSKNELKNRDNAKAKAWGAAVNIKRYGIKPTGFLTNAVETVSQKIEERLGAALVIDLYLTLPDTL